MKRLLIGLSFIIYHFSFVFAQRSANIVFIGNSITYGALHEQRELTAPPAQCARWLSAQEGIDTVYFRNCGRSGRTTYHFLPNAADVIPAGDKTYFGDVVAKTRELVKEHPTLPLVFSIMLGTNDTVERTKNSHTTPDAYVHNLCTIIDSLLTLWPDAHVVLNKPTWYFPDYHTKGGSIASKKSLKLITTYCHLFPKVVAKCKSGHVHVGDAEAYDYFKQYYKTDVFEEKDARGKSYWLHPNEQGARKLAEYWGKAILPVLQKTGPQVKEAFKGIWPVTDKTVMKTLNGEWQLKVIKGISNDKTVPAADASWGKIPVPGCWEAYGFCEPRYSFPDSLTGYYRTTFTLPQEWKGQQVIIRLDGVLRGYDLWLNNQLVGSWEQAYNTCLFDLTPYLTKNAFKGEQQQLSMRVYSRFKGHEFDNFDDWAPMGIFRDVTLFTVPKTHLSNLTVTTKINGEVMVKTEVANATSKTTTDYEILDTEGCVVSTGGRVANPKLWTAETPYLYTLRVYVKEKGKTLQTFTQKIGIREVSIDGNILKVNGTPVKLRGVTCHSTDPKTVKVISDELTLKDMKLMKEASINYIRTSHYPREPRFFELADSLGFYVVCEAPFGSRGEKHLKKPDYFDILLTRVKATIDCHKNHPSVIVWSLGNENPLPKSCERVGEYAQQLDATRPYCFPQKGSTFRGIGFDKFPKQVPIYAPHYPTTSQLRDFYTKTDRPLIFTEYCHTLGISFEDHDRQWEIIERTPGIAGGSVWEWVDQGMPFSLTPNPSPNGEGSSRSYGYEERVFYSPLSSEGDGGRLGFWMNGNQGTDGLLYADRTPLPNYYELQHNYARAFIGSVCCDSIAAKLSVTNRYDFLNLKDNVTFHWYLTNDRDTVARGAFSPDCAPRSSVPYTLSLPSSFSPLPSSLTLLHFDIEDKEGHTFLRQSFVLNKPEIAWTGHGSGSVMAQETAIRAGRKATMAERITQKGRLPEKYLLPIDNSQVKADIVSKCIDGGEEITFTLTPDTADVFRSELGLAYLLNEKLDRVQWIGQGPFASYPGRHQANRYGFWAKHKDDLYFEGNHGGVDAAFFSDKDGNGILIVGDSLNLNYEQTDKGIVMTVNATVSGQGPKFAKTAFPGWKKDDKSVSATFRSYYIKADVMPQVVKQFFSPASEVPAPFKPFVTQYDTYLMKYNDVKQK